MLSPEEFFLFASTIDICLAAMIYETDTSGNPQIKFLQYNYWIFLHHSIIVIISIYVKSRVSGINNFNWL